MACPAIITGEQFLTRTLNHIDCQAQSLGSFGYQALSQSNSPAMIWLTGLLTLFIALFGIRLLFGPGMAARDVVGDVLKVGIVLTLALSWPAYKTLVYDLVLHGPAEIAEVIASPELGESNASLVGRLQQADSNIVTLTSAGTGRNTGEQLQSNDPSARFEGTALEDEATFGWARFAFLTGTIGTLAILRLTAGLLLALAPLAAGLLFFEASRGLFAGWLRGLALTIIGSIGITVMLAVELALIEPWLADALSLRQLRYATPAAPTEILSMTAAFAIAGLVLLFLLAKVAFYRGWNSWRTERDDRGDHSNADHRGRVREPAYAPIPDALPTRALVIAQGIERNRELERILSDRRHDVLRERTNEGGRAPSASGNTTPALGSSWRRTTQRVSTSGNRRDSRS